MNAMTGKVELPVLARATEGTHYSAKLRQISFVDVLLANDFGLGCGICLSVVAIRWERREDVKLEPLSWWL